MFQMMQSFPPDHDSENPYCTCSCCFMEESESDETMETETEIVYISFVVLNNVMLSRLSSFRSSHTFCMINHQRSMTSVLQIGARWKPGDISNFLMGFVLHDQKKYLNGCKPQRDFPLWHQNKNSISRIDTCLLHLNRHGSRQYLSPKDLTYLIIFFYLVFFEHEKTVSPFVLYSESGKFVVEKEWIQLESRRYGCVLLRVFFLT